MANSDTFDKLRKLKKKGGPAAPVLGKKAPGDDIKGADFATLDKLRAISQKKKPGKKGAPSVTERISKMKEEGAKRHEMYARLNQEGHRPDKVVKELDKKKSNQELLQFYLQQYKVAILVFGIVFVLISGSFFIFAPGSQGGGEPVMDFASMKADYFAELRAQQDKQTALDALEVEKEALAEEEPVQPEITPLVDLSEPEETSGADSAPVAPPLVEEPPEEESVEEEEEVVAEEGPVDEEETTEETDTTVDLENVHEVVIKDFKFTPASLTIAEGDTVKWTNQDTAPHTVTADSGAFDSGSLAKGEVYTRTFGADTDFDYTCTIHPEMIGKLVVGAIDPVEEETEEETQEDTTTQEEDDFTGETFIVTIDNFKFEPKDISVEPGTRVKWVNEDTAPHTVTADDGSFDSGTLAKGESFSFIFEENENYPYACTIHSSMIGSVNLACEEDWTCSAYGSCSNGVKSRTCTDANDCGTTDTKPPVNEPCCAENWVCEDFSPADCPPTGERTRSCSDSNECGSEADKPELVETCTPAEGASDDSSTGPVIHEVSIEDMYFDPDEITVNVGDTIRWTNHDNVGHTIQTEIGIGSNILSPGDTFEYTTTTAGDADYICGIHPSMEGTVIVVE